MVAPAILVGNPVGPISVQKETPSRHDVAVMARAGRKPDAAGSLHSAAPVNGLVIELFEFQLVLGFFAGEVLE